MQLASLRSPMLDHPGIAHGFFERGGGVSTGIYKSLNCGWGSGDERPAVIENRGRVAAELGITSRTLYYKLKRKGVSIKEIRSNI